MTKTESAEHLIKTLVIESCEQLLEFHAGAGVRLAIPNTDALIMAGPAGWIAKNVPGVEAMVEAEPVKTWRERLPAGVGMSFDYAHICAMKAEIAELRTRLAATTQASTAQAEELVRFCPHCASIGDIGAEYRDCCPDGSAARHIPKALAEVCRDTFKLAISAAAATQAGPMTSEAQRYEAAKKSDWCPHCGQGWHCAAQLAATSSTDAQAAAEVRTEHGECWSNDEENFSARSLGELLDNHPELEIGSTVWRGETHEPEPNRLIDADDILDTIGERAHDMVGEHADGYPDVSADDKKELERLLANWISRACPPTFWEVRNVHPYVLTADDLPLPAGDTGEQADGGAE